MTYGGNTYYGPTSTSSGDRGHTPTTLSVSAGTGTYGQPVTFSGTLTNSVTGQPAIGGQTVTLTLNGSQTCTAMTASHGKASCSITPTENAGTYTVNGSFAGNTGTSPQLLPSSGSNMVVVNGAPTTITYTGARPPTNGQSLTLSTSLTSNGTPVERPARRPDAGNGQLGPELQWHTTGTAGTASCNVSSVNQITGHGDGDRLLRRATAYYAASSNSGSVEGLWLRRRWSGGGSGGGGGMRSGGGCGGSGGSGGGAAGLRPVAAASSAAEVPAAHGLTLMHGPHRTVHGHGERTPRGSVLPF